MRDDNISRKTAMTKLAEFKLKLAKPELMDLYEVVGMCMDIIETIPGEPKIPDRDVMISQMENAAVMYVDAYKNCVMAIPKGVAIKIIRNGGKENA